MAARNELREELESRIDQITEKIRFSLYRLGESAYGAKDEIGLSVGPRLSDSVRDCYERNRKAKAELDRARSFASEYEEHLKKREELLGKEREEDEAIASLSLRLGSIVYEQCSLGLLDKEAFSSVYSDAERDARRSSSRLLSMIGLGAREGRRFPEYASLVIKDGRWKELQGDRASAIALEIIERNGRKDDYEESLVEEDSFINGFRDEYSSYCSGGQERLEEEDEDSRSALFESLVSYGTYLYEKGSVWIGESTPSYLMDIIENILRLNKEYSDLCSKRDRLSKEDKADEYNALISSDEAKILILEKEKDRIDEQIASLRSEIEALRSRIDRLSL